jgi:hypothetical protein
LFLEKKNILFPAVPFPTLTCAVYKELLNRSFYERELCWILISKGLCSKIKPLTDIL